MKAAQTSYTPNSGGFLIDFIRSFPPFCDGTYFTPPEVEEFLREIGEA